MSSVRSIFSPQVKLMCHWAKLSAWMNSKRPVPVLVEFSPTDRCNAACTSCFYRKYKSPLEDIDSDMAMTLLREMAELGVEGITWTGGGEPTLHTSLNEFIGLSEDLGMKQGLFTNCLEKGGSPVDDPSLLQWIRVTYTDQTLEAIDLKAFHHYAESDATLGMCINQNPGHHPGELSRVAKWARNNGADYIQVRPALATPGNHQSEVELPVCLRELATKDFKVVLTSYKYADYVEGHGYDRCHGFNFCPVVTASGELRVCMYQLEDDEYKIGNLYHSSFQELWSRTEQAGYAVNENCQTCCKNHEINKALFALRNPDSVKHVTFI